MTRKQNHDDDASSSRKRSKTCAPWSDLNHDVLYLVMMQLGFGDYYSFLGVCKSWRLLAHSNRNKFMESRPPMSITFSTDANENICCFLEDFDGRKFKTILPRFAGGTCVGLTSGYLIFFTKETRDFWLVNPITRKLLHFPHFPFGCYCSSLDKAILVFSPSISGWVFVVLYRGKFPLWYSIAGKGAWNHVSYTFHIYDLFSFKGKIYILSRSSHYPIVNEKRRVCELRLNPEPKFTLLETKNTTGCEFFNPDKFVGSRKILYMSGCVQEYMNSLGELDLGEMKWVVPCEKTMEEYSFFHSILDDVVVVVKPETWADPRQRLRLQSHGRYYRFDDSHNKRKYKFFVARMWYFPHECMDVDRIDE